MGRLRWTRPKAPNDGPPLLQLPTRTLSLNPNPKIQVDGQGNDMGTQYRSGLYYHTAEQKAAAEAALAEEAKKAEAEVRCYIVLIWRTAAALLLLSCCSLAAVPALEDLMSDFDLLAARMEEQLSCMNLSAAEMEELKVDIDFMKKEKEET